MTEQCRRVQPVGRDRLSLDRGKDAPLGSTTGLGKFEGTKSGGANAGGW